MAKEQHVSFTFSDAVSCGNYDERPILPKDIDLQLMLSRNDRPQPFHLICEHDCVLAVMAGEGRVEFRDTSVLRYCYSAGDYIYVPAGTPHRIIPKNESIHYRYKLPESELEGVAWYCNECGDEVYRDVWELAKELPQEGYQRACDEFNTEESIRTCPRCGVIHPRIDTQGTRWMEVASMSRASSDD